MDIQDIYSIVDRFEQSSMTEFQIKFNDLELTCKRNSDCSDLNHARMNIPKDQEETELVFSAKTYEKTEEDKVKDRKTNEKIFDLRSKVAGTFYRAASPESEPFVQIGQKVKKGDIVGMIEAMKMMNDIISPVDGVITEIRAKNEELVEFDAVLLKIAEQK